MEQEIGTWQDWKFGLINREVYRISEDEFEIHETSGSWLVARVNKETLQGLKEGRISLLELDWS